MPSIVGFLRFIQNRRAVPSIRVFLLDTTTVVRMGLIAGLVIFCIRFVDPIYLAQLRSGELGSLMPGFLVPLADFTTDIGKSDWFLLTTGVPLLALATINAKALPMSGRIAVHDMAMKLYFLFSAVAFSGLLVLLLKNLIGRARPLFHEGAGVWTSASFQGKYAFASFPSGHSTTAGALMMALILLFPRWRWLFIVSGLWIAATRTILGVHFPSDAVAGLGLGVLFSHFYARAFMQKRLLFKPVGEGSLALKPFRPAIAEIWSNRSNSPGPSSEAKVD